MRRSSKFLALVFLAISTACQAQDRPYPLTVGDPAPALALKSFVKGKPFTAFEKGKVYVVDMWATWCGPCRRSIPEITELANKYKGKVECVGVSVWERDQSGVAPFVQKMGDKMDYTVAMDQWPKDAKSGREGVTAKSWMEASGMKNIGIPTAFVVGRDGAIEWIGHPDNLAKPLDEIVNGTYDRNAFATTFTADMVKLKSKTAIMATYNKAVTDKDWKSAETDVDQLITLDPSAALTKFDLLLTQENDRTRALAYGKELSGGAFKSDPDSQTLLAWSIADYMSQKGDQKRAPWIDGLDLALQAAQSAVDLKASDSTYLMVLARIYNVRGEKDKAISTQKAAIASAPDPSTKDSLTKTLKEYGG
jgi:thiol-disulfide isomerase/thioredoxin